MKPSARAWMACSSAADSTTEFDSGWPLPPSAAGMPLPCAISACAVSSTRSLAASGPLGPISGTVWPLTRTGWRVAGLTTTGGTVVTNGIAVTRGRVASASLRAALRERAGDRAVVGLELGERRQRHALDHHPRGRRREDVVVADPERDEARVERQGLAERRRAGERRHVDAAQHDVVEPAGAGREGVVDVARPARRGCRTAAAARCWPAARRRAWGRSRAATGSAGAAASGCRDRSPAAAGRRRCRSRARAGGAGSCRPGPTGRGRRSGSRR